MKKLKNISTAVFAVIAVIMTGCGIYTKKSIDNFSLLIKNNINPAFYRNYKSYFLISFIFAVIIIIIFAVPFFKRIIANRGKNKTETYSGEVENSSTEDENVNNEIEWEFVKDSKEAIEDFNNVYADNYVLKNSKNDAKNIQNAGENAEYSFICECGCPITKDMDYCPECGMKINK